MDSERTLRHSPGHSNAAVDVNKCGESKKNWVFVLETS